MEYINFVTGYIHEKCFYSTQQITCKSYFYLGTSYPLGWKTFSNLKHLNALKLQFSLENKNELPVTQNYKLIAPCLQMSDSLQ